MPLLTQLVAGNSSDEGWYVPAYEEAIKSTGKDIMVMGDSKMSNGDDPADTLRSPHSASSKRRVIK